MNVAVPWAGFPLGGGLQVGVGAVPGVDEGLGGMGAGVGSGLVEHRGIGQRVRGAGGDVGGGDDLVGVVHDRLGVVCLHIGTRAVAHDPRLGVGEVGLR